MSNFDPALVDRAARAARDAYDKWVAGWEDQPEYKREDWRNVARAVLEAASAGGPANRCASCDHGPDCHSLAGCALCREERIPSWCHSWSPGEARQAPTQPEPQIQYRELHGEQIPVGPDLSHRITKAAWLNDAPESPPPSEPAREPGPSDYLLNYTPPEPTDEQAQRLLQSILNMPPAPDDAAKGWCPECDGPSQCAPGTCPGVGAPEADRGIHRQLDKLQTQARLLGFCCYAAAIAPRDPCPWHATPVSEPARELCNDEHESESGFGTPVYHCVLPRGHAGRHSAGNAAWGPAVPVQGETGIPADLPAHVYVSTACQHAVHDQCRRTCKFCPSWCRCDCHAKPAASSPVHQEGSE